MRSCLEGQRILTFNNPIHKGLFYEAHVIIVLMWPELYQALQRNMCTQVWDQFLLPRDFFQSTKDKEFTRHYKPGDPATLDLKKGLYA